MGLFDIFRKKPNQGDIQNENILETALRKAATEPAFRAEFYKKLLSEKLIVLTAKTTIPQGEHILEENTNVDIATLQDGKIPVFTSTAKIFDKGIIKEQVPFLAMKGEDLFNLATGATFIINPYSDHGKELLPSEIESLLKGTILTGNHKQFTVEQDTQIQIGQPANYPTDIVNSLKALFANRPTVKSAYLGWIYNPSSGEPPHLIFALDIDGKKQNITNEAGFTAQQLSKPEDIIDFIQVDNKDGLSDYFLTQTKPFYTRS
ncbi:MAG TPA: enhanced serine sensitivity protein SseB C-terminal domain-containing protein [Ferruginibacter sp.]|nr:enhanced serine sensitivity protein SseB C-terminal domain-containing protein [Ferruginibacter sp.]